MTLARGCAVTYPALGLGGIVLLVTLLAACAKVSTPMPATVAYPCATADDPVPVADTDATQAGFTVADAVAFIDGFELTATYDPEQSADMSVPSETVTLSVTRTDEAASFV